MLTRKRFFAFVAFCFLIVCIALLINRQYHFFNWRKKPVFHANPSVFRYSVLKSASKEKGYLLLSPYQVSRWRDGQLVIMDFSGNVIFQRNVIGAPFCFRQWQFQNRLFYSYLVDDRYVYHIPHIGMAAGYGVLLDSSMNIIKEIRLLPFAGKTFTKNEGLDLHDMVLLSPDHYIVSAVYEKKVTNIPQNLHPAEGLIVDVPVIEEIINDRVVWHWDASEFPELYQCSEEGDKFNDTSSKHDYLHLNSIFLDPSDSNLILSFRHASQVIKVSRFTGKILWKLGGEKSDFQLNSSQIFIKQHHATIDNRGWLTIFDNGDTSRRKRSRVLEFKLDEQLKKITGFDSLPLKLPFALFMGSVAWNDSSYLIGGGTGNYLVKYDKKTNEKLFELRSNLSFYRVYEVNDIHGIKPGLDQQVANVPLNSL